MKLTFLLALFLPFTGICQTSPISNSKSIPNPASQYIGGSICMPHVNVKISSGEFVEKRLHEYWNFTLVETFSKEKSYLNAKNNFCAVITEGRYSLFLNLKDGMSLLLQEGLMIDGKAQFVVPEISFVLLEKMIFKETSLFVNQPSDCYFTIDYSSVGCKHHIKKSLPQLPLLSLNPMQYALLVMLEYELENPIDDKDVSAIETFTFETVTSDKIERRSFNHMGDNMLYQYLVQSLD